MDESQQEQCMEVCPSNVTEFCSQQTENKQTVRLTFLTHRNGEWFRDIANRFVESYDRNLEISIITKSFDDLFGNIVDQARAKTGLYDGFVTPPSISGMIAEENGWAELKEYIQESAEHLADWSDILVAYRKYVARYQGRIIMFPLDGDVLSLYYRKDVLETFNLTMPRTWDEYSQVAKATHGVVFDNETLVGSCIGRVQGCAGAYWANLLISSITQTQGQWSGHLFDTRDMSSLITDDVMQQVLEWMETQVLYGADNEFEESEIGSCIKVNLNNMHDGKCVLSYNWGDMFKQYLTDGSKLRNKLGVAKTPGSSKVLDRETMRLVNCDENRCQYGAEYNDIGWVNQPPYLAFGGWVCAVNNFTDPIKKRLAMELCHFASRKNESLANIVPNATGNVIFNGQDPFRESQLNVDYYISKGYEEWTTNEYINTIKNALASENVVTECRFPTSTTLYDALDRETFRYLSAIKTGEIAEMDRKLERSAVAQRIRKNWTDVITAYDKQQSTNFSVLEAYQKERDVYHPEQDLNLLGGYRWFGFTLAAVITLCCIGFSIWTIWYRKTKIVRASQPLFLVMICVGALVFSSVLFPLAVDDSLVDIDGCNRACKSIPWLLALGFTIMFSGLYAKLRRVNIVFRNASKFRRVRVSYKDVMLPCAILTTVNVIVLVVWTVMDPLRWERKQISPTESYGHCNIDNESNVWLVSICLLGSFNMIALLLANIEAYRARHVSVEYGESKYIAIAMVLMVQIFVVGVPILFLVYEQPSAYYFIITIMVSTVSLSNLLLLFVPKIWVWAHSSEARNSNRGENSVAGLHIEKRFGASSQLQHQLNTFKAKVDDLELLLRAEGHDVDQMFQQVGLRTCTKTANGEKEPSCSSEPAGTIPPTSSIVHEQSSLSPIPES